jgi:hypothetical protein
MDVRLKFFLILISIVFSWASPLMAQTDEDDIGVEENLDFAEFADDSGDDAASESGDEFKELSQDDGGEDEFKDFAEDDGAEDEFKDFAADEDAGEDEFKDFAEEKDLAPVQEDFLAEPAKETPKPIDDVESPLEPVIEEFQVNEPYKSPSLDTADSALEARLHQIYLNFNSSKTPEEQWSSVVGERQTENYVIQSGDNLWNVSKTFFGDGNYWPKIWSVNAPAITNPHVISPNNNIRFALGDESSPPVFTVTESAVDSQSGTITVNKIEVEIPEPLKKSVPVIKKLPPSFPAWQSAAQAEKYDDLGIDYGKRKILDVVDQVPLNFYVDEKPPAEIGAVKEIEEGSQIASAYQYIYVDLSSDSVDIGDTLLVVLNRGAVITEVRSPTAYSIEVQGEIQLVERVDASDKKKVYRAIVTKLVNPISVGASLLVGKLESIKINESGPRSQAVAQIIGGQFFNRRLVYGTEAITYLNRGSEDGLRPGDILPIRENRIVRNSETRVSSNLRPIGWLQIVKVTPRLATAVILKAWSDVRTGDVTGAGNIGLQMVPVEKDEASEGTQAKSLSEEFESKSSSVESGEEAFEDFNDTDSGGDQSELEDSSDSFEPEGEFE